MVIYGHFNTNLICIKLTIYFPELFFFLQLDSVLDLIAGGSRSTTPVSLNSRKSPTAEMGVQVNQKDGTRRTNNRGQQGGRLDSQGSHENRVSSIILSHFFFQLLKCFLLAKY